MLVCCAKDGKISFTKIITKNMSFEQPRQFNELTEEERLRIEEDALKASEKEKEMTSKEMLEEAAKRG
jgi:preprotein translocase subunit SecB